MPVSTLRALALGSLDRHMLDSLSDAKKRIEQLDNVLAQAWYTLQLPAYRKGRVTLNKPSNWYWYRSNTARRGAIAQLNWALRDAGMKEIEGKGNRDVIVDRFRAAHQEIKRIQKRWERYVTAVDDLLDQLCIAKTYEDLWFMDKDGTRRIQRESGKAWGKRYG